MNIRVLFFGAARDAVGANQMELALEAPATVSSAFQSLKERFSKLERFGRSLLFAVNQEYATPDTQLQENDELAVFPPVSGGSQDFFELTTEPIDVGEVARRVVLPECGAAMRGAGGDHDACLSNLDAAGAVHDADVGDLELLVRFGAEALHLR